MKTRKILFAVLASASLFVASCTQNSTAEEDQLYQDGVDRTKVTTNNKQSVDRTKITTSNKRSVDFNKIISEQQSVDRTKVRTSNKG